MPAASEPALPPPSSGRETGGDFAWLTDDEQKSWRAYLRASRALELTLDTELQQAGMSLAEYELLSMLSEADAHSMRMSQLADLVIQSRSRVTHTATRLERRGWVQRRPAPHDGRGIELVLTPAGLEAVEAAALIHVQGVQDHLVRQLDPMLFHALGVAMTRVREHLNGHYRP
ncbi:MarR family transcriptional regulator [Flexivirga sp. ID2601S]|uniref:MarR family transcriptional regulator n=1 Tax=Flexivirga aerilata TaxID=1656889 RepID=A0A849ABL7_9MICO|nr:MarR family transcriptional regulator [Flexivirga aerilata]NNG37915.1 MarR family transcriptional regulator [Flexivirga aerilata]